MKRRQATVRLAETLGEIGPHRWRFMSLHPEGGGQAPRCELCGTGLSRESFLRDGTEFYCAARKQGRQSSPDAAT